ncbi:hypothetical protein [Streptomyces sp. NPDC046887]|uniref:hypothetical protein n=1 Tax=Streptomyces sp. NPDC046887 TaxID=3155472 RepID=UPI0033E1F5D8
MELARTAIGLVAAVSIPAGLTWYKQRPAVAILFAAAYAAIIVLPVSRTASAWLTLLAVVLLAGCIAVFCRPWPAVFGNFHGMAVPVMSPARYGAAAGAAVSIALLVYVGGDPVLGNLESITEADDRLLITCSGLLIAVFGCQFIIGLIVRPLLQEIEAKITSGGLPSSVRDFIKVGPHVGWIERFILFAFLASGSPEAAALVVTAKSFARAPEAREGGKLVGDYYLIGTLASVAAALLAAGVTRVILGLSPL